MHSRAQCHAKWPSGCQGFQHPMGFEPKLPYSLRHAFTLHWAIDSYWFDEKNCIWLVLCHNLEPLFCMQNCRSLISQVEHQGQTWYTRILERKPLMDTSFRILHRLELKYFHFAQFFLNAHGQLIGQHIHFEKVRTDILKFRAELGDWVMDGWPGSVKQ